MNPCLPIHHTAATLHAWAVWRAKHPFWTARAIAPACIRAAAVAVPLLVPGAAFVPGGVVAGPVLRGPAYEIGAVFVPGVYEIPSRGAPAGLATVPAGTVPAEVDVAASVATGGYPVTVPLMSGDVPIFLPSRGDGLVDVPEPGSVAILLAALVACVGLRRWVR